MLNSLRSASRDQDIEALRQPPDDKTLRYHAIAFEIKGEDEWVVRCLNTHWVDWGDDKKRTELRASAPVTADYAESLKKVGISYLFVVDASDLFVFVRSKLPGLVECSLAERFFPSLAQPAPACHLGRSGFTSLNLLSKGAGQRRPTAKQREAILARDAGRCCICKRNPKDFEDMELEIHHIRPWRNGGTSDPANLITLCRRCHKGLKPHFSRSLFDLVEQDDGITDIQRFAMLSASKQVR